MKRATIKLPGIVRGVRVCVWSNPSDEVEARIVLDILDPVLPEDDLDDEPLTLAFWEAIARVIERPNTVALAVIALCYDDLGTAAYVLNGYRERVATHRLRSAGSISITDPRIDLIVKDLEAHLAEQAVHA